MSQDKPWLIALVCAIGLSLYFAWPSETKPFFAEGEFFHGSRINLGLDLQGGSELRVQLDRRFLDKSLNVERETDRAISVLERRINHHGLKEPRISRFGEDQIIIQLPGIDQAEAKRVKDIVTRSGKLEFKIEADEDVQRRADYQSAKAPKGYKWYVRMDDEGGGAPVLCKEDTKLTGDMVKLATYGLDTENPGKYEVNLTFNSDGRKMFADITRANVGKRIAIILDDKLVSAPVVREPILGGTAQITGDFKQREAADLSTVLRSGSLPAPLLIVAEKFVGPSLGEDAIQKGLWAGLLSVIAVLIFMVAFYRSLGWAANIALLMNVIFLFGFLAFAGATLTLPGIAGIVLTLGMAVDSNIIIYERIRDESEKGKGVLQAFESGFDRAFWTVFDANLTTFIIGVVLYAFGTGAIRGFAVTLMVGIVTTMITALSCTKLILHALLHTDLPWLKITEFKIARAIGATNYPFMKLSPKWIKTSVAVIAVTMLLFIVRGRENFGVDFNGGSVINVGFREAQGIDAVRQAIRDLKNESGSSKYADVEVQSISTAGQVASSGISSEFAIRTASEDAGQMKADLMQVFGDKLGRTPIDPLGKLEKPGHPYHGGDRYQVSLAQPMVYADFDKAVREAFDKASLGKPICRLIGMTVEPGQEPKDPLGTFEVITHPNAADRFKEVKDALAGKLALSTDAFSAVDSIGGSVARKMAIDGIKALVFSWVGVILYLAIRFELMFGIAAVIALIHDVLISMGVMGLTAWLLPSSMGVSLDIGLTAMAAFLTIVGYSVNDTIVVFDRIRESMQSSKKGAVAEVIDEAINQTLSRSLMTSATVFLTVLILFVVNARSGGGISQFSFPMLIGVIVGTYSSIFIAAPLVVWVGGKAARDAQTKAAAGAAAKPA